MSEVFRMDEVRRSVARISFRWTKKTKNKDGEVESAVKDVVIAGLIVSTGVVRGDSQESVIALVDGTFFRPSRIIKDCTVKEVHLPNAEGGYTKHDACFEVIDPCAGKKGYLWGLKLTSVPKEIMDYLRPLMFETALVGLAENVYTFVFPQEGYITPTAYCPGYSIDAIGQLVIHGCYVHEYAHYGTPLLNERGNAIGINSGSQGRTQAWSVNFLKEYMSYSDLASVASNISYCINGKPFRNEECYTDDEAIPTFQDTFDEAIPIMN